MTEVMHNQVEQLFRGILDRYFSVECREDRQGNVVCQFTARNARYPLKARKTTVKIPKSELENHGYVHALTEQGIRELIYPVIR